MATLIENNAQPVAAAAPATRPSGAPSGGKATMRIKEFLYLCLSNWMWFVLSVAVCMGVAYLYVKRTAPIYRKSAAVMIQTDTQGRSIGEGAAMFEDMGISTGNKYLRDEIVMLQSPDLMREVVRRLNLDVQYHTPGRFRDIELYGPSLPVRVSFLDLGEGDNASMKMSLDRNGDFTISNLTLNGKEFNSGAIKGRIGTAIKTPLGKIEVRPAENFNGDESFEMNVSHLPVKAVAGGLNGGLAVVMNEDSWNIVEMTMTDTNPDRASDVLTSLIEVYNDRWMNDKRTLADNSSRFIEERVQLLQNELGSVDSDISSFKSANLVPDVDAAASMYMSQATQASTAVKELRNQEYMAKYIRNSLNNSENENKLLPANAGISNSNVSGQISQYNAKILERNSLVSQSSATNPLVTEIDQQLSAMRGALVASIDNEIMALGEQIKSQEGLSGAATSKIASNPQQAKYLLSVERQQKVKESLYLYLLQKREENQLSQAFQSYNTRMVREADGSNAPIAPNGGSIMMIAFGIGLALPTLLLFQREMSVHVVRGRKDVKDMQIPFAGELPIMGKKQKLAKPGHHRKKSTPIIAVKENSRNSINEAFRVLRTNVEFMFGSNVDSKVVMFTSANPGSGKTFISYNLAKSFAIKNKKCVIIDLDMRKSSLSKYVDNPAEGISDYLANRIDDITRLLHKAEGMDNLQLIPVGTVPPNPTELLFSERLHALIEDLRIHFDYVFIDCPPVEVVADASIISKYADHTLFVVRAGILDLSMLPVIDEFYEKGSYPNMSLILNGTLNPRNPYARRYGNPYSYGYGYGTGYSYSSED